MNSQIKKVIPLEMPAGFLAAGISSGIKPGGKKDMALLFSEKVAAAAGAFTANRVVAAPVRLSRKVLAGGNCQAVIVNSGCANACTGYQGQRDAEKMAQLTARGLNIDPGSVAVCSTGRIGNCLPMDRIAAGISSLTDIILKGGNKSAHEAIMTTDTFPKSVAVEFEIEGTKCRIWGIAKGAGMINPNMVVETPHATMLSFLLTDLGVGSDLLRKSLSASLSQSFNRITVDGDTSTNDTVILMANGASGARLEASTPYEKYFQDALNYLTRELALMIVSDGEGATKLIKIEVQSAASPDEARIAAASVANSLLLKCAIFGETPNWGRLMAALGYSGVKIDEEKITVSINGIEVIRNGLMQKIPLETITAIMKNNRLNLLIDLGMGHARDCYYTCDISHEYVNINKY